MTFAEKILYLRKKKEIPQNKLAKELNVSRQAIYKWESGACLPEIDKIKKLAEIFEISYDVLLNDNVSVFENEAENENIDVDELSIIDTPCDVSVNTSTKKEKRYSLFIVVASLAVVLICALVPIIFHLLSRQSQTNENVKIEHTEEHELMVYQVYSEPTCEEKGRTLMLCSEPNCIYSEMVIKNPLGHQNNKSGECTVCGLIKGSYGILYATEDGENYFVKSIGRCTDENIVISNKCNGKDVVAICDDAFKNNKNIKSVKIPSTIKTIGKKAFYECSNLSEVKFQGGVVEIDEYAFYNCAIEELLLPISLEKIGAYAFSKNNLTTLKLGSKLNEIGQYAFMDCVIKNFIYSGHISTKVWKIGESNSKSTVKLTRENLNRYSNYIWRLEDKK